MLDMAQAANAAELPHSFGSTPTAFADREPTVAELMSEIIIRLAKEGQPTSFPDLRNAGFTAQQIGVHFPKAKAIADAVVIRQDAIGAEATYSRAERLEQAKAALNAHVQPFAEDLLVDLNRRRFNDVEILELWPDLMQEASRRIGAFQAVA
jgi:hypothetical protein